MGDDTDSCPERAEEIKILANEAFKGNKFSQAIELYSQAIALNNLNAVYWANRAFAHIKLEEYGSAILDATKAIEINPSYSKGYYRRGAAHLAMGKFKDALKDFQQVKRICPNDPDATRKLKECEKAVQKLRFQEAIAVHDSESRSVADSIDYKSIVVEPQYSGASIEGEVVTLDFVKKMMDDFKNQKCIHKRYGLHAPSTFRRLPWTAAVSRRFSCSIPPLTSVVMSASELACTYAALILHDDGIAVTAEKISTLVKAANVEVESYWPSLFAKLLENRNVEDLIMNVGSGGGGGAAIAVAAPAAGGAAADAPAPAEEKKEEPQEESDDDMGFSLFD